MEIFDHQQERAFARGSQEDLRKLGEEAAFLLFRVERWQGREGDQIGERVYGFRKQGS